MGGDWHGSGRRAHAKMLTRPSPSSRSRSSTTLAERGWAAEWISALLAREKIAITPEVKDHLWSALGSLASGSARRTHADRPVGAAAVDGAQARRCSPIAWVVPLGACSMPRPSGWATAPSRCSKPKA